MDATKSYLTLNTVFTTNYQSRDIGFRYGDYSAWTIPGNYNYPRLQGGQRRGGEGEVLGADKSTTINGYKFDELSADRVSENYPCLTWYPFKICVAGDVGKICEKNGDCGVSGKCE